MGERTELKIIRTNLEHVTLRIASIPGGPTWFAQKLEEKAFISSSANALVLGWSNYDKVIKLMSSVLARISTAMDAEGDFRTFIGILHSNVALEDLARHLLNRYSELLIIIHLIAVFGQEIYVLSLFLYSWLGISRGQSH